jgi:hypothetical protein
MKNVVTFGFISCFLLISASAYGSDLPWRNPPKTHSLMLESFNGTYELTNEQYSPSLEKSVNSQCPGRAVGEKIAVRANTIAEQRNTEMYYNESLTISNSKSSSQLLAFEHIDQGKRRLAYKNGPRGKIMGWLICQVAALSPDCERGYELNDAYYKKENIRSINTLIETEAYTNANAVWRTHASSKITRFDNESSKKQDEVQESLQLNADVLLYTLFSDDQIARNCRYKKLK